MFQQIDHKVIEVFISTRYDFRYNLITGKAEFKLKSTNIFREMDDYDLRSIHRELKNEGNNISISSLHDLLLSDFSSPFDPFLSYLNDLPAWDGKTDYIGELANSIQTTDQKYWIKTLKKWITAVVASMISGKIINQQVIILVGPQGIGKSTWIINLVPHSLIDYIYSGTINPNNKDTMILLAECMLIILDELENLTGHEYGSLKELITKPAVKLRRPYGRFNETLLHRASFIGSVNHYQFLKDPTGSRRFLCHEVEEINFKHNIDIDLVFAQALFLFRNGFKYWFDGKEIDEILLKNRKHELISTEEDLVMRYFEICPKSKLIKPLTTSEIALIIKSNAGLKFDLDLKKLGGALRKHFERIKVGKDGSYGYTVKLRE
jgi:predicted P-loop ATPase